MMADRISIRDKLMELEKLRPELLEEAMRFIEYLIHREKEKQSLPEFQIPMKLNSCPKNR